MALICLVFAVAADGINDGGAASRTLDSKGLAPAALLLIAMVGAAVYRTDAHDNLRLLGERVSLGAVLGVGMIVALGWLTGRALVEPGRLIPVVAIGACGMVAGRWLGTRLINEDRFGSGIVLVGEGRRAAAVYRAYSERAGTRLPRPTDVVPLDHVARTRRTRRRSRSPCS